MRADVVHLGGDHGVFERNETHEAAQSEGPAGNRVEQEVGRDDEGGGDDDGDDEGHDRNGGRAIRKQDISCVFVCIENSETEYISSLGGILVLANNHELTQTHYLTTS